MTLSGSFLSAQQSTIEPTSPVFTFDQVYGPDYNLINGKKYIDRYASALGHPFLENQEFKEGWLIVRDEKFEGVQMMFNIYEQQLVLQVPAGSLGIQQIVVPNLYLERFGYQGRVFRKLNTPEKGMHYYEFLTAGRYAIVYSYDKRYTVSKSADFRGYRFSELIVRRYIYDNTKNKRVRFKNNVTFRKAFPPEMKENIRSFMKDKKIRLRKAGRTELTVLMDYINEID